MSVAVEKRRYWKVSPSAIVTYRDCPRKWFNGYVLYDREPEKPFQLRGTAIHKAFEIYMSTGEVPPTITLPDASNNNEPKTFETLEFVQVGIEHLPPPANNDYWKQFPKSDGAGIMVEQHGELGSYQGGPAVTQYIDLIAAWKNEGKILDFKTRSKFLYNKTPMELAVDPQLIINAKWLFSVSDYNEIELCHLNLLTSGRPKAVPVRVKVDRAHVEKVWLELMSTVREMCSWVELATDAQALPPNTESCDKYSGCFYRPKCGFAQREAGAGLFSIRKPSPQTPLITGAIAMQTNGTPANGSDLLSQMLAGRTGAVTIPGAPLAVVPVPAVAPPALPPTTPPSLAALLTPPLSPMPAAVAPAPLSPAMAAILGAPAPAGVVPLVTGLVVPVVAPVTTLPITTPPAAVSGLAALLNKTAAPAAPAAPSGIEVRSSSPPAMGPPAAQVVPSPVFQAAAVAAGYPAQFDPTAITPPDAPVRTSTPEEVAAANANDNKKEEPADETALPGPQPGAPAAPVGQAEEITKVEGPGKRKRRTKAEMEAARAAEAAGLAVGNALAPVAGVINVVPPVVAGEINAVGPAPELPPNWNGTMPPPANENAAIFAAAAAIEAAPPVAPPAPDADGTLAAIRARLNTPDPTFACPVQFVFVNCLPGKGWPVEQQPRHLDEFMAQIANNAAAAAGVADYRMIRYESKAYLSASIRAMMRGLPSSVYVDTETPGADEFLTQVVPYASMVIRGVR